MNDTAGEILNNAAGSYADFIEEAFIKPIRTVTIVDDEYPTMDILIDGELSAIQRENITPLKEFISVCRKSNNWMLDVYDRIPESSEDGSQIISTRLHNSDFLILDYHLEGNGDDGPGCGALKVLNHLASTPHFNLVAIYTKGYDGDIDKVLKDIVCYLQAPPEIKLPPKPKTIEDSLDKWSIEEDEIHEKLIDSISDLDLLCIIREYGTIPTKWPADSHYISELKAIYDNRPEGINLPFPLLLWWVNNQKIENLQKYFGETPFPNFGWGMEDSINWIHTDQLFVTIIGKNSTPDMLPQELLKALTKWHPHPHKLILTKLRHLIDEQGIAFANKILDKEYLHAHWLKELLTADEDSINFKTWNILCKHWDEFAAQTKKELIAFTLKMADQLKNTGSIEKILQNFTNVKILEDKNRILLHANCFNCSKPVEGYHLTTGHILEIKEKGSFSYWVCVTPACDLVPEQNSNSLKDRIPITLLRLYEGSTACQQESGEGKLSNEQIFERALKKATSKKVLFLNLKDNQDVCIFSPVFNIHGNANPKLEEFIVGNLGKFDSSNYALTLYRTVLDNNEHLVYNTTEASVVAQLRYEYALDLLVKTGGCKSRIGLDFIGNN